MDGALQPAITSDISDRFIILSHYSESFGVIGIVRFVENADALALDAATNSALVVRLTNNADWIDFTHGGTINRVGRSSKPMAHWNFRETRSQGIYSSRASDISKASSSSTPK